MLARAFEAKRLMLPHKRKDLALKIILCQSCYIFLCRIFFACLMSFDLLLDDSHPLCALILLSLYFVIPP